MSETQRAGLSPETVLSEMKKNGVTHVVWLPDSETNWLFLLLQAEPSLRLVGVNREGLAFSAAAGISAGGKTPLILIQNTGLMESGDSLRGWALDLNVPAPRSQYRYGRGLHRALPQCVRGQLLPGRGR
jgi:sulfopyruvate decarboxylase TPP-binding subunit